MKDINKEIEILENVEPYGLIKQNEYDFVNKELYIQAQNNLIKAYRELEEANKRKSIEIICYQEELENSILVSLVEEKIEEIQKEYEETLKTANFKEIEKMNKINFRGITLEGQRSILQELLEKR